MKIALGTAQFGLPYGVSNANGIVNSSEVKRILDLASSNSIDMLDTAISYGRSEEVLGSLGVDQFNIVNKLPNIPNSISDIHKWVNNEVSESLKRLKKSSFYALLLHNPSDLIGNNGQKLIIALEELKKQKIVKKVGVSIYDPNDLDFLTRIMDIDIVQAPINIVDRRLVNTGWLEKLNANGVEIHGRSIFMQGLL